MITELGMPERRQQSWPLSMLLATIGLGDPAHVRGVVQYLPVVQYLLPPT